MKRIALAVLILTLATSAQARWQFPWNRPRPATATSGIVGQIVSHVTGSADPMAAALNPIGELVKEVTGPQFVEHANAALAMAGASDPMFSQCVAFKVAIRQELIDVPLVAAPVFATASVDTSCPLCVVEALRQDREMVESGALAARVTAARLRVRGIGKRWAMACGPLLMDEANVAGHVIDVTSGLLGR